MAQHSETSSKVQSRRRPSQRSQGKSRSAKATQAVMMQVGLLCVRLAIMALVIYGVYQVGHTSYMLGYSIMAHSAMEEEPGRDIQVTLDKSMGVKDVALLLERKGLIEDADIFRIQLKVNKYESKLHLGSYVLNTSMTSKEIMQVLAGELESAGETE